jgi:hypothetical protein
VTIQKIDENWREISQTKIAELVLNAGDCAQCGKGGSVTIQEHLVNPTIFLEGEPILGGPVYPHVMLTCGTCGHTRAFNFLILSNRDPHIDLEEINA